MIWPNNHRVIWNMFEIEHYSAISRNLILSDCSESPPGLTLLQLLTPAKYKCIELACVRMNERLNISSSKYRWHTLSVCLPNGIEHGPCSTCIVDGIEYDYVQCFACDFWPPPASSWIDVSKA